MSKVKYRVREYNPTSAQQGSHSFFAEAVITQRNHQHRVNETNWVSQSASPTVTESDRKGLEKAHRYEKAMLKNGYRWHTINSRTKILVECDKDGNPTQRGKQQIKRAQENCGTMK